MHKINYSQYKPTFVSNLYTFYMKVVFFFSTIYQGNFQICQILEVTAFGNTCFKYSLVDIS